MHEVFSAYLDTISKIIIIKCDWLVTTDDLFIVRREPWRLLLFEKSFLAPPLSILLHVLTNRTHCSNRMNMGTFSCTGFKLSEWKGQSTCTPTEPNLSKDFLFLCLPTFGFTMDGWMCVAKYTFSRSTSSQVFFFFLWRSCWQERARPTQDTTSLFLYYVFPTTHIIACVDFLILAAPDQTNDLYDWTELQYRFYLLWTKYI